MHLGQYHHFGIAERLRKLETKFEAKETVKMQVNIDGLALLCNCGQYQEFWKALGSACIVGAFVGKSKPNKFCMQTLQDIFYNIINIIIVVLKVQI